MFGRRRAILASLLLAGIALTQSGGATPARAGGPQAEQPYREDDMRGCPGSSCRSVHLFKGLKGCSRHFCRWPASQDGLVYLRYWINPERPGNVDSPYTGAEIVTFIRYAARTWEYTNPRLRFEYMGVTDRVPVPGDGFNDIGFFAPATGGMAPTNWGEGEWDVSLSFENGGTWFSPCRFHCPSVEPYEGIVRDSLPSVTDPYDGDAAAADEIGIIVHELGHVLSLDHPVDGSWCTSMAYGDYGCDPRLDAWYDDPQANPMMQTRHRSTPALGEIAVMKALYPYTCPRTPKGYRENVKWSAAKKVASRTWLPWRYRQVCPTIAYATP